MLEVESVKVTDQDMPILFRLADTASKKAQNTFILCMSTDLVFIILASVLGAFAFNNEEWKSGLAIFGAIFMTFGLFLTAYMRRQRFEQNWYDGRAIAESVKTRAWRFMVCAEPYPDTVSDEKARGLFLETLQGVMKERETFSSALGADAHLEHQITKKMMAIRKLPLLQRRSVYLNQRIDNQREWYSKKSGQNRDAANNWFLAIMAAQFIAVISSLLIIKWPNTPINVSSIFASIAAAFIAWVQLKRHRELSNSYGLASQELGFIAEQVTSISEPKKLSDFILDAENAISREHTLWIARRDNR